MNQKKFLLLGLCISSAIVPADVFVKPKKTSNADRENYCQVIGEQIKQSAQLIEDCARLQKLLLEETTAYLANEKCLLLKLNKKDLQELHEQATLLNNEMKKLDKKIKSHIVNIESKKNTNNVKL